MNRALASPPLAARFWPRTATQWPWLNVPTPVRRQLAVPRGKAGVCVGGPTLTMIFLFSRVAVGDGSAALVSAEGIGGKRVLSLLAFCGVARGETKEKLKAGVIFSVGLTPAFAFFFPTLCHPPPPETKTMRALAPAPARAVAPARARRATAARPVTTCAVATKTVRIGTRGSPLALAQAYLTRDLLKVRVCVCGRGRVLQGRAMRASGREQRARGRGGAAGAVSLAKAACSVFTGARPAFPSSAAFTPACDSH